jgi:hypothetical protein
MKTGAKIAIVATGRVDPCAAPMRRDEPAGMLQALSAEAGC